MIKAIGVKGEVRAWGLWRSSDTSLDSSRSLDLRMAPLPPRTLLQLPPATRKSAATLYLVCACTTNIDSRY